MPGRPQALRVAALLVAVALAGCGGGGAIELRLHPCDLDGPPGSVRIAVQARDGAGAAIGEVVTAAFSIPDASIFDDDVATAAYEPPEGTVTADFTIAWFKGQTAGTLDESEHVVIADGVAIPKKGAVDLAADGCMPAGGGTTTDGTTTDGTTDATTDATTDTTTSTTDVTTSTTDVTTTTDATTEVTTSTTDVTTSTTEVTTSTGDTTTTGDTDTTTGTGGPMEGGPCDLDTDTEPLCVTPGGGQIGQLLRCVDQGGKMGAWEDDVQPSCAIVCTLPFFGFLNGVAVGCSGNGTGEAWGCLCAETGGKACVPADQMCTVEMMTETIYLCDDGDLVKGSCPGKCVGDDQPICAPP